MRGFLAFFLLLASPPAGFVEATARSGIGFRFTASKTASKYLIEAMGGGVALFDADGDGRLDLFLVNGAALRDGMTATSVADKSEPRYWNRLYRNEGDGRFRDITEKAGVRGAGYGQGVAVGDCDNDGRPDLFVTSWGANQLYRNGGEGQFEEITEAAGVRGSGWSTSAGFVDYDRDGQLDLFVARYLDWDFGKNKPCGGEGKLQAYCHPNEYAPVSHLLYRNKGGCRFEDVTAKAGIAKAPGKGLGVAFDDFDQDGWPDILVANDSFPQQLFRNRGNGTFEEAALNAGLAYDDDGKVFAGMGITVADYDHDGWPDVFVNALANQGYALFRNVRGLFEYVSPESGLAKVSKLHSGWGARFVDFDNDGWKDLLVAQGHVMDNIELTQPGLQYLEKPLLARNVGGKFVDVSATAGAPLATAMSGRGAAFGDWNNDGAVDVVIATNEGAPRLLQGIPQGNWLMVQTVGSKSNRDGQGAAVRIVTAQGRRQFATVTTSGSYLSAHDPRAHFGLGTEKEVSLVEVRWPSGQVQSWKKVPANQVLIAREMP